jgi:uncharacterized membrane protein YsdA (DUF1294 family)
MGPSADNYIAYSVSYKVDTGRDKFTARRRGTAISTVTLPVFVLIVFALFGVTVAVQIGRKLGRYANFRTMVILVYVMTELVSGIVHLSRVHGASRGYFDVLSTGSDRAMATAVFASVLGLVALCVACLKGMPNVATREPPNIDHIWLTGDEKIFVSLTTIVMIPITVLATVQIQSYVQAIASSRVIALSEGNARFSYLSNWLVWAICFLAIGLVASRAGRSRFLVLCVLASSIVGIALALQWNGGRSVIVALALPLILVFLPRVRGLLWFALPLGGVAALAYIAYITGVRTAGTSSTGSSITTWLDWEWGRFSMLGWSAEYVESNGYLLGETFGAGLASVLLGVFRLVGIPIANPPWLTSTQVSGSDILGNAGMIHIVPGFSAELFLNFGMVGVVAGYYLLGRLASWVDGRYFESPTVLIQLLFAYLGTLLVFRSMAADSGSIPAYIIYTGLPLLVAAAYSHKFGRAPSGSATRRALRRFPVELPQGRGTDGQPHSRAAMGAKPSRRR